MNDNLLASKQRIYWVDFLKGIMIFLVVLGHCGIPSFLLHPIYMFHMPIFFVISGYLYNDKENGMILFLKSKARGLLYPYFVLGTLIIIYNTVTASLAGRNSIIEVLKRIAALLYGNYIWDNNVNYIGVLWFVAALFCAEILYYIAMHLKGRHCICYVVTTAGIGTILSVLNMYKKIRLPWCLDIAFIAYLFFFVGAWLKSQELNIKKSIWMVVFGFGTGACNLLLMKVLEFPMVRVDMLYMNYGILPIFLISASLISVGLMGLTRLIYDSGRRFRPVEHMGRISILIMVIHLYVIQLLGRIVDVWLVKFMCASFISIVGALAVEKYTPWLYRSMTKK